MINYDILIKVCRSRGFKDTWPDQVNRMINRLNYIKSGFPGIRNDHLSLVTLDKITTGDIFILDSYIESGNGDEAPLMLRVVDKNTVLIEGIGCGLDSTRDPNRIIFRWKNIISFPNISGDTLVYRVDVRPTECGGPGYYYFFKSYRDYRGIL